PRSPARRGWLPACPRSSDQTYTRAPLLGNRPEPTSPWRPWVKGAAAAALATALAVPLLRKRLKAPKAATLAAGAAGPPALAVFTPRSRLRDAAIYGLQMWAFLNAKDLPHDDPEALRRRLRIDYPIRIDRAIGAGELPNVRIQRALAGLGKGNPLD